MCWAGNGVCACNDGEDPSVPPPLPGGELKSPICPLVGGGAAQMRGLGRKKKGAKTPQRWPAEDADKLQVGLQLQTAQGYVALCLLCDLDSGRAGRATLRIRVCSRVLDCVVGMRGGRTSLLRRVTDKS